MGSYSKEDIFNELDKSIIGDGYYIFPDLEHGYYIFPDLEHGYFYTAGNQINLFADESHWAIVFEKTGYDNRGLAVIIELNYFGNCLINLDRAGDRDQFICNSKFITLISREELSKIEYDFEFVSRKTKNINVRDNLLEIEHDYLKYKKRGIEIQDYDNPLKLVDFVALTRYLDEEHPILFRATDDELRTCLPNDLPKILVIDKFNFFSIYSDPIEKPSEHETFQQIAEVLISRDTSKWQPTLIPNNDWRNWPEAGGL